MNSVVSIISKEFREIWRDPYTVGIAVILPLVLLFLFTYGMDLDVDNVSFAVVDLDHSPQSRAYTEMLANIDGFELRHRSGELEGIRYLLDQGKIQAAVVIPNGFARDLAGGRGADVQTLVDGTFPTTAQVVRSYIEAANANYTNRQLAQQLATQGKFNQGLLAPPVIPVPRIFYNPSMNSTNFIVPGIIGVILMAFSPLLSALAIAREKEHGSIQQIFISPVRPWQFIVGKLIPYVLITYAELILLFVVARYWFAVPVVGQTWWFFVAAVPYVISTVAVGVVISTLTNSQLVAMLLAIVVGLMPAFIFSGFMYPIFSMPRPLQIYTYLFPGRHFTDIAHGIFLKGTGWSTWRNQAASLIAYSVLALMLASWRFRKKVA